MKITGSKAALFRTVRQLLITEGYQVTNADEDSGTISTAPRNLRMAPAQADCGTTMGIDYLKDNRTTTRVALGLVISENGVTVKANIEGEYKPGAVDQDITLTCVSRSAVEQAFLQKLSAAAIAGAK
ncbi:MAG: hypothetical protein Q8P28_04100 [Deltaproteobacteria bacterium]|nr:hypothetical protein [Deltaproteobacteria bacterium]